MTRHPLLGRPRRSGWIAIVSACSIVLLIAVFAASCGGGTSGGSTTTTAAKGAGGGGAQVVMKGFAFDPASVTVKVGESVTWTNNDNATHTVTADNGEFKSSDIAQGATFTFKFDKAGTYPYHCSIHPSMTGTVIVK
jgi:plastocyanin